MDSLLKYDLVVVKEDGAVAGLALEQTEEGLTERRFVLFARQLVVVDVEHGIVVEHSIELSIAIHVSEVDERDGTDLAQWSLLPRDE